MKVIYLGVIIAKNYFGHICAWYVINTIILFIVLNHFCSNALTRVLSYRLVENELEFGVSGSIKNQSLVQFCSKKCSYNMKASGFNENIAIYVIRNRYKILMQMRSLSYHSRCL